MNDILFDVPAEPPNQLDSKRAALAGAERAFAANEISMMALEWARGDVRHAEREVIATERARAAV